jgi:uncharacterized protein YdeI (YjbR/CyaY-like superfamily)
MTKSPEIYFLEGCGRCSFGGTPDCKVHRWTAELQLLREIILDCGLEETSKWGVPCYMHGKANVLLLGALKDCCTIGFHKGVLLDHSSGLLEKQGENSNVGRIIRFTSIEQIVANEAQVKALIFQAIEIEKQGLKVAPTQSKDTIPAELETAFEQNPELKNAFVALTPGKQRGYLIHFNQTKNSETRTSRIEKCVEKILRGEGMHDYYKSSKI